MNKHELCSNQGLGKRLGRQRGGYVVSRRSGETGDSLLNLPKKNLWRKLRQAQELSRERERVERRQPLQESNQSHLLKLTGDLAKPEANVEPNLHWLGEPGAKTSRRGETSQSYHCSEGGIWWFEQEKF